MSLIVCKECGKEVSSKAKKCINCGYPIKNEKHKEKIRSIFSKKRLAFGLSSFLIILVAYFIRYDILACFGFHSIQLEKIEIINNEGIGDDWTFKMRIWGNTFDVGEVYIIDEKVVDGFSMTVESIAIEQDKIIDNGIESTIFFKKDFGYNFEERVIVKEGYKSATVLFRYRLR